MSVLLSPKEALEYEMAGCREHLSLFIEKTFEIINPGTEYIHNWNIDCLAEYLEACARREIKRLIVNVPPRSLKSISTNVAFPAWLLGHQPTTKIMSASYSLDLSLKHSVDCRMLMQSDWYQMCFPGTKIAADQNEKSKFMTTKRGERFATSVGATTTGAGGEIILCDDPHAQDQAQSDTIRASQIEWFDRSFMTRLNSKEHDVVIVIMQRLHQCLLPDTIVQYNGGSMAIKDIKVKDFVLTSNGYEKVVAVANKKYSGKIYGIKLVGHPDKIWVTGTHKFLTHRGWVHAEHILTSDRVLLSTKWMSEKSSIPSFPALKSDHKNNKVTCSISESSCKVSKERLQEFVDKGLSAEKIAKIIGYGSRTSVQQYCALFGIQVDKRNKISEDIVKDDVFWEFVGAFLSDGCVTEIKGNKNVIRIVVHEKKSARIKSYFSHLKKYGIKHSITTKGKVRIFTSISIQLGEFLRLFGHGAHNKFLPEFSYYLPINLTEALLLGASLGDAYTLDNNKNGAHCRMTSVSLALLEGYQRCLLKLGATSTIFKNKTQPSGRLINGVEVKSCGFSYELRYYLEDVDFLDDGKKSRTYSRNKFKDGNLESRIKSIDIEDYDGIVYDIETPSHDFICGIATLHNCDLTGHLLKKGGWTHLCLPAYFDKPRTISIGNFKKEIKAGEYLQPGREGKKILDQLRRDLGEYGFAGQFLQNPVPEGGGIIKQKWFELWPADKKLPNFSYVMQVWDTAFTEKMSGDPSACITIGVFFPEEQEQEKIEKAGGGFAVMLIDCESEHLGFPALRKKMIEMRSYRYGAQEKAVDLILIEDKASGQSLLQEMKNAQLPVKAFKVGRMDKTARLHSVSHFIENGLFYIPESTKRPGEFRDWAMEFVNQVCSFPAAEHDDYTDCLSSSLITLSQMTFLRLQDVAEDIDEDLERRDPYANHALNPYGS